MGVTLMRAPESQSSHNKITPKHLSLLAYIYIRQSTPKQVERNKESQIYQRAMAQRAEALGWTGEHVRFIDSDQGITATSIEYRDGFKELVAEVSLGHVGIILGYEVSRMARNNSEWYTLLDLAAVFGTLIADCEGVYDPRLHNDRMLLGLKGAISEAEGYLIRQRLSDGRMTQVVRGAYQQRLPTGFVRMPDGSADKDPNERVRHTIEMVFHKFAELGSCYSVRSYLQGAGIQLPRQQTHGPFKGQLLWKSPSTAAIYEIINNPAYAGAFVYGRHQADKTKPRTNRARSSQTNKPRAEWLHIQQSVYPAYISWEQFQANLARLHQNSTRFNQASPHQQGIARNGAALLQGFVTCGMCALKMHVNYNGTPRYFCNTLPDKSGVRECGSLHGPSIDKVVVKAFFEAIHPSQLDALEAVLTKMRRERGLLLQQWQERLEHARYEVQKAEQSYNVVDSQNRLVAAELERRWDEKLHELRSIEEDFESFLQKPDPSTTVKPEVRQQLQHMAGVLPQLWANEVISNVQKKELLRCLIRGVILKRIRPDTVEVRILWVSGHYTVLNARTTTQHTSQVSEYKLLLKRIYELWQQGSDDKKIALQLENEGFQTAKKDGVAATTVQRIRLQNGWNTKLLQKQICAELQGHLTLYDMAKRLGVNRTWVYRRIKKREIEPKFITRLEGSKLLLIKSDEQLIEALLQQKLLSKRRLRA
jgi:DNA invertase Pin-like site-specific DNA recombinase